MTEVVTRRGDGRLIPIEVASYLTSFDEAEICVFIEKLSEQGDITRALWLAGCTKIAAPGIKNSNAVRNLDVTEAMMEAKRILSPYSTNYYPALDKCAAINLYSPGTMGRFASAEVLWKALPGITDSQRVEHNGWGLLRTAYKSRLIWGDLFNDAILKESDYELFEHAIYRSLASGGFDDSLALIAMLKVVDQAAGDMLATRIRAEDANKFVAEVDRTRNFNEIERLVALLTDIRILNAKEVAVSTKEGLVIKD